jgi:hypothetical protein
MKAHATKSPLKETPPLPMPNQLADGPTLLEILFPKKCRPTLRWLREQQSNRTIPFIRIGRLVFFDPVTVRAALNEQKTAKAGMTNLP